MCSFQDSMISVFKDKLVPAEGLLSLKRTFLINKTISLLDMITATHSRDQCQSGYMLKVDQDFFLVLTGPLSVSAKGLSVFSLIRLKENI